MHFYAFHPAKFNFETKHLSRMEKAIYRELIDEYMSSESSFFIDIEKLRCRMSCDTQEEFDALSRVLNEFFVIKKDKKGIEHFHHPRLDGEIRAYRWNNRNKSGTQQRTSRERKERFNKEKNLMIEALRDIGLNLKKSIAMNDLRNLYTENLPRLTDQKSQFDVKQRTGKERFGTDMNDKEHQIFHVKPETVLSNQEQNTKSKYVNEVNDVFEFWKSIFGKNDSTILSDKRKSKVIKRLEDGYSIEQIKQAIYNCSKSEYHISNNYTDLELICRDIEKIDRFLGLTPKIQQVNGHENHRTINTEAQQSTYTKYGDELMGQIEREIGSATNQSSLDDSYRGNVYDMESPV